MVDTSDEWIKTRTGMNERRVSSGEYTWEMGTEAAKRALKDANCDAEEIDMIVVSTITPDYFFPSCSCIIQGQIGADHAFCFDISAACSGFVYAVNIVKQYINNNSIKKALIVCSETISRLIDYTDRSTSVLFGDAASAAVVEASEEQGILAVYAASEGKGGGCLAARALENKTPFTLNTNDLIPGINQHFLHMDGKEVYKFAIRAMHTAIEEVLKKSGVDSSEIKYFIPHQANKRIIDSVASKYKMDSEKVYINLDKYGNTSSVTIPLCIDELAKAGKLSKGDKLLLAGFGAGLTYGAVLLEW